MCLHWLISCWLGSTCAASLSAVEFRVVVEEWHPECFEAVVEEREDPERFERLAYSWLEAHEQEVAADMAQSRGLSMVCWWHEADHMDDSPYGATIVVGWKFKTDANTRGGNYVASR